MRGCVVQLAPLCTDPLPPRACLQRAAQQDAERARYVVEKAKQDKKSTVIRAQGEARSAEMIGTAISDNPGFVELRRLEAAREIAATVSASQNRLYLNSDTLLLNLMGSTGFEQCVPRAVPL